MTGAEYVAKDLGMKVATTGIEALGTARKARRPPRPVSQGQSLLLAVCCPPPQGGGRFSLMLRRCGWVKGCPPAASVFYLRVAASRPPAALLGDSLSTGASCSPGLALLGSGIVARDLCARKPFSLPLPKAAVQ